MALAGCTKITLVNRDEKRGRELEMLFGGKLRAAVQATGRDLEVKFVPWRGDLRIPDGTNILANATSIGLYPDVNARIPLAIESLSADTIVADVIPNPPVTRLVHEARARGCRVIDGLGMLVGQGVIGVEYWTGKKADAAVMRRALEEVFA
jgi:shikimate 5-dehydrogenase